MRSEYQRREEKIYYAFRTARNPLQLASRHATMRSRSYPTGRTCQQPFQNRKRGNVLIVGITIRYIGKVIALTPDINTVAGHYFQGNTQPGHALRGIAL